ncbi:pyridoxal-phosphate dependent enzyme [Pseudomonadales bacterium]|nr:pyridoxal-phosphate dependent enzyme [Pseudomonadales bacterium]
MSLIQFTKNVSVFCLEAMHPGGNKYYKLKHNFAEARRLGSPRLLSFGGAWSNHIHALALMGQSEAIETIGVIRGERPRKLSATLQDAESLGMKLHFISRQDYRSKTEQALFSSLREAFGDFYLLPEGGTNALAVQGACEIVDELRRVQASFNKIILPFATGGTLAGVARSLKEDESVIGISVVKGDAGVQADAEQSVLHLIESTAETPKRRRQNWSIDYRFHCGGYAKCPAYLRDFMLLTEKKLGYPLEPVYSGKMLWAVSQMLEAGEIGDEDKVVALHTGGLQGRRGFPELAVTGD